MKENMERDCRLVKYFVIWNIFELKYKVGYCSKEYFVFIILFNGFNNYYKLIYFIKIYKFNDIEIIKLRFL